VLKCSGLSPGDLARRSVTFANLSLLGLVRHMADVERGWFKRTMAGQAALRLGYPVTGSPPDEGAADAAGANWVISFIRPW
jgi:uncharacterized damage-inducible protein DinB